jgi:hypothetical protein
MINAESWHCPSSIEDPSAMQVGGIYTQGRGEPGGGGCSTRVKTLTNTQKRRVQRGRRRYGGRYRSARMTVEIRAGREGGLHQDLDDLSPRATLKGGG